MIALPPDADLDALEAEIRAEAAEIHARTARLAARLGRFDELDGWRGYGLRDCADWVVCNLGFDRPNARALMLAAGVAREFTEVGDAFSAGELSVDKMRLLGAGVIAAPDEQSEWVDEARRSSAPELARRCREVRNDRRTGPERDRAQRVQRRLCVWYDEENMFRISGALPSYEGAIVQNALTRFEGKLRESKHIDLDSPDDPNAARRADALVWICEAVLGESGSAGAPSAPPAQIVVHADYDVLTGANPNGRGHLEDGPAVSTATLRRLGCDATIKTLIERDGVAIAEGRETPVVPPRMKRAARSRDRICGYPGCAVPATECEAHHIHHVYDDGPTVLWNILSLCDPHHDAHHRGEFHIRRTPTGDLEFLKANGEMFGTLTGGHWKRPKDRAGP